MNLSKNLKQRLITCCAGIPLLVIIIACFPQKNYLVFSLFTMLVSLASSIELSKMLNGRICFYSCVSWLALLCEYLFKGGYLFFAFLVFICFACEIKLGEKDNFELSAEHIAKNIFICLYPSFFMVFLIKLLAFEKTNTFVILLYIMLVFSNDILAYVFGMRFGKNNAGIFKVSPKKSVAGFAGSFLGSMALSLLLTLIFKSKLSAFNFTILSSLALGAVVSISANVGDLAESVIKRACKVKDSGNLVPGRGGVLDCIDSICLSLPFFYAVILYI